MKHPEDDSSESDVKYPLPPSPSPAESPAALDLVVNITMTEDNAETRWKFVFLKAPLGNTGAKINVFFSKLKCGHYGLLLVTFY